MDQNEHSATCRFLVGNQTYCKRKIPTGHNFCWQHTPGLKARWRSLTRNQSVIFIISVVGLLATLIFGVYPIIHPPVFKVPAPESALGDSQPDTTTTESVEITAQNPELIALGELYIEDEHNNPFVQSARVRKGSVFSVRWDGRDVSSGPLHLLLRDENGKTIMDKGVEQMGVQRISSDYPISVQLLEEYNGKKRLIKALPVKVF
jgi:hypothetical protein